MEDEFWFRYLENNPDNSRLSAKLDMLLQKIHQEVDTRKHPGHLNLGKTRSATPQLYKTSNTKVNSISLQPPSARASEHQHGTKTICELQV